MKVLGFMPIHYGKEYLKESLLSIVNHCEKVVVAYTQQGSHGYASNEVCPDSKEEIYKIAFEICKLGINSLLDPFASLKVI
jgi:hypothetical protein